MPDIGPSTIKSTILIILIVVVLLLGAEKLPELARSLDKTSCGEIES